MKNETILQDQNNYHKISQFINDPNTEDLPIPDMIECILKKIAQMELSHTEMNILKNTFYQVIRADLVKFDSIATYHINRFLDLSRDHYRLRKNLSSENPPSYSDLAFNNRELTQTFLYIENAISEYNLARIRLDIRKSPTH